jgi:cytochrome c oxidase subunit I
MSETYLQGDNAFGAWFKSRDHKRIGLMFLGWSLGALLLGAIFSFLLTMKPFGAKAIDTHFLYQVMTYHRLILVFLFVAPALPSILGFFLLPGQLGAADMALPGFSRCSLRFYALGMIFILISFAWNPVASSWTLLTPLSLGDGGAFTLMGLGLFFAALSWFMTGVNFIVTVHHGRESGMGFFDMPLLSWSLYLGAYQLVVSGLLFCIIILYLMAGNFTGKGLFGLTADPLLWQRYFWFTITPAALFALIPAVGVISDVIAGVSRQAIHAYRSVVGAMIALLGLGLLSGGVNLAGFGQSAETSFVFSAISLLVAVPMALITFSWLYTMAKGHTPCNAASTYVVAFLLNGGIAVLMGLILASPALGHYLGTTMFASTRLDYLIWGAILSALLAGLHFWWPVISGAQYNTAMAVGAGRLYLVGINLALIPRIIMGTRGLPQDMLFFAEGSSRLGYISSIGWFLALLGLVVAFSNLASSLWKPRA